MAGTVTAQERKQHRAVVGCLAVVLRQRQGEPPTAAALQAIAADLVGDKTDLLLPLKDLASTSALLCDSCPFPAVL